MGRHPSQWVVTQWVVYDDPTPGVICRGGGSSRGDMQMQFLGWYADEKVASGDDMRTRRVAEGEMAVHPVEPSLCVKRLSITSLFYSVHGDLTRSSTAVHVNIPAAATVAIETKSGFYFIIVVPHHQVLISTCRRCSASVPWARSSCARDVILIELNHQVYVFAWYQSGTHTWIYSQQKLYNDTTLV